MKRFLFLLLSIASLVGCSTPKTSEKATYDYDDIQTHIEWNEVFSQSDSDYLVYFYSLTCGHCKEMKEDILSYYFKNKPVMYFVETSNSKDARFGPGGELKGISDVDNFFIFGTPFLIRVITKKVSEYYSGVKQIRDYINMKA